MVDVVSDCVIVNLCYATSTLFMYIEMGDVMIPVC